MYLAQLIFMPLAVIGSVTAAVINKPGPSIERRQATQSCHATCHGLFASYSVWVGVPYGSQSCDNTYNNLEWGEDCAISNWQCVGASDGNTQLWFNAPFGNEDCLNPALQDSYTMVNDFNCPGC